MYFRLFTLILLTSLISGCGFHLRGSGPGSVNISSVYVDASTARHLAEEVKSQLSGLGVAIASSSDAAEYVLKLNNEKQDRKVLSVSSQTGKVEEYELIYSATMSVIDATGKSLSKNQRVAARRDLSFDEAAVLGKFDEERTLQEDLRKQVAASVLRRLNAVVK